MGRSLELECMCRRSSSCASTARATSSPVRDADVRTACETYTDFVHQGTDADSNILKIYRMLDRNGDDQFHYYQPGIGTYVTKANGSMTRTSRWEKFQSWYAKAKDSAIGTSFDLHVMAGYKVSKYLFQGKVHERCVHSSY
jgi:uncharacterized protein (DUF2235 family)